MQSVTDNSIRSLPAKGCGPKPPIALYIVEHGHPTHDHVLPNWFWVLMGLCYTCLLILLLGMHNYRFAVALMVANLAFVAAFNLKRESTSLWYSFHRNRLHEAVLRIFAIAAFLMLFSPLMFVIQIRIIVETWRESRLGPVEPFATVDDIEGHRLVCCGRPRELQRVSEIQDVFFEPVIVHDAWFRMTLMQQVIAYLIPSVALVTLYCMSTVGLGITAMSRIPIVGALYFGLLLQLLIVVLRPLMVNLIRGLCPRYYRIVPGRMDVLDFALIGEREQPVKRIDLRTAHVKVHYGARRVEITPIQPGTEPLTFELPAFEKAHYLAESILLAALSTATPAPLPDDQLLG